MNNKYNVVIVGGGFSGVVAATILAEDNLSVLMIDENTHLGGQLLRKIPNRLGEYKSYTPDRIKKIGFKFIRQVKDQSIKILNQTTLVGIYQNNTLLLESDKKEIRRIRCDQLLFATGARERFLPFPGWTLPGIYSTGMTQVLIKSSGILPARKMIIGGSGLFLLSAAYEFLKNGGKLLALLEHQSMFSRLKLLPHFFRQFSKFTEGARFLAGIYSRGVFPRYRWRIVEARGQKVLKEIVAAPVDSRGSTVTGKEKIFQTDAAAIGYGFVANVEAPQLAGCILVHAADFGGWIVQVDDSMETSVENIYAAGEITGVGGAQKSVVEGKIAALSILNKFGKISGDEYSKGLKKLTRERKHHLAFARCFNALSEVPAAAIESIPGDTIICRCEHVTLNQIKEAVEMGCRTPDSLKLMVRTSMGQCQGRTCGNIIYDLMALLLNKETQHLGCFSVRPPLKPVPIRALKKLLK